MFSQAETNALQAGINSVNYIMYDALPKTELI